MPRANQSPLARAIDLVLNLSASDRQVLNQTVAIIQAREARAARAIPVTSVVEPVMTLGLQHASKAGNKSAVQKKRRPRRKNTVLAEVAAASADPGPIEQVGEEAYADDAAGLDQGVVRE